MCETTPGTSKLMTGIKQWFKEQNTEFYGLMDRKIHEPL
jgi:hypothetical protein